MNSKKRGLGRGLDALLGIGAEQLSVEEANGDQLKVVPVDLIQRGQYQPRMDIDNETLQDLAESIRAQGVVQPVVIRPLGETGRYELIAGERRWRAAQLAGLGAIPAIIKRVADADAMSIALIENIQREQLNPIEEALALDRLVREFDMTHQQVAEAVGRSRAGVSNLMRLLELEPPTRELVEQRQLEMGHARALLGLAGEQQVTSARHIAAQGLSVREAEALVRRLREGGGATAKQARSAPRGDPDIMRLEQNLAEKLGANVAIRHGAGGRGTLTIRYTSLDELDGILAHIK
ncbi:MAG: ParB/RepB/Spo0J family partition protein [Gammaproteobacteria bacterium]|uniref:ParB/RepB/Spo0J family partition protein n=1 Tax=Algiphilus sp. TaxID=1872431 RepID=UPI0032ECEA98